MRLLLLAGTGEARELAGALAGEGVPTLASLAGATRDAAALPVPTRIGGFGGSEGFLRCVSDEGIDAVVDATHPFASRITARTAALCAGRGIPYLRLERPGWREGPGDAWVRIPDEATAAARVGPGQTVFLATGRQTLERFRGLAGRRVYLRVIDPPDRPFPFPRGAFVRGRAPFTVPGETALFRRLGVDVLVCKDSGGDAARPKLDAARALGLTVLMIDRPPPPDAPRVATVDAAMEWVRAL